MPDGATPVLDVRNLKTVFKTRSGEVHAVNSVSFDLKPGELLGVVGESGSGKSVTMMSLIVLSFSNTSKGPKPSVWSRTSWILETRPPVYRFLELDLAI